VAVIRCYCSDVIKELRTTLEFYADYENWKHTYSRLEVGEANKDRGDRARLALTRLNEISRGQNDNKTNAG